VVLTIELRVAGYLEIRNLDREAISAGSSQFQSGGRTAFDILRLPFSLQSGAAGDALVDRGLLESPAGRLGPFRIDSQRLAVGRKLGHIGAEQLTALLVDRLPCVSVELLPGRCASKQGRILLSIHLKCI